MRRSRSLSRLATLAVAAAVLCGVPTGAEATTWSIPRAAAHAVTVEARNANVVASDVLEDALLAEINEARAANGLRKIRSMDACTDQLAEEWGQRIARTGILEHRNQSEVVRKCNNNWAGETLVRGIGLTPGVMVDLWLDSPGHRAIILSPLARRAGVSIEQDGQGRVIGVVNLVRRST